jgi:hypothetical protein
MSDGPVNVAAEPGPAVSDAISRGACVASSSVVAGPSFAFGAGEGVEG